MGPSRSCWNGPRALQPEAITSKGTRVPLCTINKSAHTKKSLETYRMHLVCLATCNTHVSDIKTVIYNRVVLVV